jgi:hypothetical protein
MGMQALLSGEVDVIEGCAVVRPEARGAILIPVLPAGDDRIDDMVPGESVDLGGGSTGGRVPENSTIPEGCDGVGDDYWIVF